MHQVIFNNKICLRQKSKNEDLCTSILEFLGVSRTLKRRLLEINMFSPEASSTWGVRASSINLPLTTAVMSSHTFIHYIIDPLHSNENPDKL